MCGAWQPCANALCRLAAIALQKCHLPASHCLAALPLQQKSLCTSCLPGPHMVFTSSYRKVLRLLHSPVCGSILSCQQCTRQQHCTPSPYLAQLRIATQEPALPALCSCTAAASGSQYLYLLPIGITVVIVAAALGIWVRVSLPSYVSQWNRKRGPPEPGKPVTLVLTDVEGSTELWEWQHEVTGPLLDK